MQSTMLPEQCGLRLKLPVSVSSNPPLVSRKLEQQESRLQMYDVSKGEDIVLFGEKFEIWRQHCSGIACLQCYITGKKLCAPREWIE